MPENYEVDGFYDLDGDGQSDLEQDDIRLFQTPVGNFVVGVKTDGNYGHLHSVGLPESFPVDPQLNQLERTPMGVIQFQFSLAENVDTLPITLFWSRPAPEEANWFTYSYSDGWHGFDETGGMDFSGAGFALELRDGGFGDMDGAKNGTILHSGTLGIGLIEPQTFPTLRPSNDIESTGCFIDTFFFPTPNP